MSRVLVVSLDHVGSRMAGPGIRALRFAEELSHTHDVTLSVPAATDLRPHGFELAVVDPWRGGGVGALAAHADVVIAQWLPVPTMRKLARAGTRTIYDLYDPWPVEELARDRGAPPTPARRAAHRLATLGQGEALALGDAFVCASERQRDFWLGWLGARGRLTPEAYADDPSLRSLIDVVPFGIDPEPPRPTAAALRGVVEGIGVDDSVILWGGGIWHWLDAETVIRAVARLADRRPGVRLYFPAAGAPGPGAMPAVAGEAAVALARELGVLGTHVVFGRGWVAHEERSAYLLEADVGVVAHRDDLETHLAFRTRLLDYFWAGLPVVTTRGDVLAEEVERRGLGRAVAAGDVEAWTEALDAMLGESPAERTRRTAAFVELRAELAWPRTLEPLRRLVAGASAPRPAPRLDGARADYLAARLRHALAAHGVGGSARRLLARAYRSRMPLR